MKRNNLTKFNELYFKILTEEVSPTTFTPVELLDDIRRSCFYSSGTIVYYTLDELKDYLDERNKPLFSQLIKHLKYTDDYAILILYFTDINQIDELMTKVGYLHPHSHIPNFSLNIVHKQIKDFFLNTNKFGVHFNSIDVKPELGCVIGINGAKIKSGREFEKQFDHELNHYFEQMNIHFNYETSVDNIENTNNKNIINKINEFYGIDVSQKTTFINDLKYHLFNHDEFRSMCANVFHEILNYNETHFKQLDFHTFINDILTCNYQHYSNIHLQEMILFCWINKQLSENRWNILLERN